jgi:hypothetical protein
MEKLQISIILIIFVSVIMTSFNPQVAQGEKTSDVSIQNIQLVPPVLHVGDTFIVNATLLNNSTHPIFFHNGYACDPPFSVTFDKHVVIEKNKVTCVTMFVMKKLNPNETAVITSPSMGIVYGAAEAGTTNANLTLKYDVGGSYIPGQSNMENATSRSFSFTINSNDAVYSNSSTVPEFPFTMLVMTISIASLIVFNRKGNTI